MQIYLARFVNPSYDWMLGVPQGAYNSGKHGNLREFVNSGKFRENSGNLKFTQGIYQMLLIVI